MCWFITSLRSTKLTAAPLLAATLFEKEPPVTVRIPPSDTYAKPPFFVDSQAKYPPDIVTLHPPKASSGHGRGRHGALRRKPYRNGGVISVGNSTLFHGECEQSPRKVFLDHPTWARSNSTTMFLSLQSRRVSSIARELALILTQAATELAGISSHDDPIAGVNYPRSVDASAFLLCNVVATDHFIQVHYPLWIPHENLRVHEQVIIGVFHSLDTLTESSIENIYNSRNT